MSSGARQQYLHWRDQALRESRPSLGPANRENERDRRLTMEAREETIDTRVPELRQALQADERRIDEMRRRAIEHCEQRQTRANIPSRPSVQAMQAAHQQRQEQRRRQQAQQAEAIRQAQQAPQTQQTQQAVSRPMFNFDAGPSDRAIAQIGQRRHLPPHRRLPPTTHVFHDPFVLPQPNRTSIPYTAMPAIQPQIQHVHANAARVELHGPMPLLHEGRFEPVLQPPQPTNAPPQPGSVAAAPAPDPDWLREVSEVFGHQDLQQLRQEHIRVMMRRNTPAAPAAEYHSDEFFDDTDSDEYADHTPNEREVLRGIRHRIVRRVETLANRRDSRRTSTDGGTPARTLEVLPAAP
jgi:hypothetical protein